MVTAIPKFINVFSHCGQVLLNDGLDVGLGHYRTKPLYDYMNTFHLPINNILSTTHQNIIIGNGFISINQLFSH